ncbi:hypothetical protein ABPG73_022931 [Tetrahymena malaccensis]
MIEQSKRILKSALQLAQLSKKNQGGQRNIFNKWFQDSVKNYLFEQITFSLIGNQLKCNTSIELQEFIHKNIDKSKPKYMSIIDQYFFYINKYGQSDLFIQKLKDCIKNPIDISQYLNQITYKIEKAVRKQLVCYLILRFFEVYEQCQIPSFYELWNYCFPDEIQKKKKRSKFDNKQQISQKINSDTIQAEFSHHSECVVNSKAYFCTNNQNYKIIQKQILDNSQNFSILLQFLNNTDLPLVEASYPSLSNKQTISQTIQKKEINNGIISDDEESGENHMTNCSQMCIYDKQLNKQNEKWYENADENELKKTNQCQYLYEQQDQNQFYYQNFYQDLPQIQNEQIIDLNYQNTGGSNYQMNQKSNYFPMHQYY